MEASITLLAGALIRLTSMVIGAFFCYLGYRLFIEVPLAKSADAELSGLQGATIKLTRVAPGVFFALFGSVIVVWALAQRIELRQTLTPTEFGVVQEQMAGATNEPLRFPSTSAGGDADRSLVLQEVRWLNQVTSLLSEDQAAKLPAAPLEIAPSIKRRLMLGVWDDETWGSQAAFIRWLEETGGLGEPQTPALKNAYEAYSAGL